MKNDKLSLKSLKVQSFVTAGNEEALKGGVGETFKVSYCPAPGGCTFYCPSGWEC